jgi:hypothetical protein
MGLMSNKEFAKDYLRRFPEATEADAIALEALLVMTTEHGMAPVGLRGADRKGGATKFQRRGVMVTKEQIDERVEEARRWVASGDELAMTVSDQVIVVLAAQVSGMLAMATPWPLKSILEVLCNAADHLFAGHGCDHHGWEEASAARDAGRALIASVESGG